MILAICYLSHSPGRALGAVHSLAPAQRRERFSSGILQFNFTKTFLLVCCREFDDGFAA